MAKKKEPPNARVEITSASGTNYKMEFGTNTFCRMEEQDTKGRSFGEFLAELMSAHPRIATIRQFVRAALIEPADVSLERAGEIIDDIGGAGVIESAIKGIGRSVATPAMVDEAEAEAVAVLVEH